MTFSTPYGNGAENVLKWGMKTEMLTVSNLPIKKQKQEEEKKKR